ncbi:AAA family ATPase [Pseudomonas sp. B5(2017)]|uniref:AAA family ATPase n=1 Tax=Pseudomonas sp. B5(2017) TaxID=1981714 RepID=UPI000A1F5790|nr:AAA family ATPase [Pseudomonas sp. B5(2017)]
MDDRLLSFEINDLYGLYNHQISFSNEEGLTIIHGPNGVGKTALLRSIHDLFSYKLETLSEIPFSTITARLASSLTVTVKRIGATREQLLRRRHAPNRLEIEIRNDKRPLANHTYFDSSSTIREIPPWFEHIGPNSWLDARSGEEVSDEEVTKYLDRPSNTRNKKNVDYIKSTLDNVKVYFVETNRLYREHKNSNNWKSKDPKMVSSVRDCASQLTYRINTALKNYGAQSQELDQTFPYRFISGPAKPMDLAELKSRLSGLAGKLAKLKGQGILESENIHPFDSESLDKVEPHKLEIMSLYVRDSEVKLAVFDSLSDRVELLLGGLKEKFKNKKIKLSREKGLIAVGPGDLDIPLEALSSGEQHEIVLLHELLFKVPNNCLVLIDEPELSLHVSWQKAFLPELLSISKFNNFYSIVATHSPYIVGHRYDLMMSLDADLDESLE